MLTRGSNYSELLPPRISFCKTIEQCLIGLPKYHNLSNKTYKTIGKNMGEITLYKYSIVCNSSMKYVKRRLVNVMSNGIVQNKMQEICVASVVEPTLESKLIIKVDKTKKSYIEGFVKEVKEEKI
ncbi:hypothetical protein ACFFHK_04360 [Gallibacterium trehalosifermentans]|uniref:Uncharacterized protein n=1 Tax=Gallibacterium trehalosifermentans TaxID=516935 RepID=A0ABV6H0V2_9PAST